MLASHVIPNKVKTSGHVTGRSHHEVTTMQLHTAVLPEEHPESSLWKRVLKRLHTGTARVQPLFSPRCSACGEPLRTPQEVQERFCADKQACEELRMGCYW